MPASQTSVANFNNVLTATESNRRNEVTEQWADEFVFSFFMNRQGGVSGYDGGVSIFENLATKKSSTTGMRAINDPVPLTKKEFLRPAEFVATTLTDANILNFFEMDENAGSEKILDLWDEGQKNVLMSMKDEFNRQSLTGVGVGNDFGGLPLIVADDPTTGTVGGINRATAGNTFWRNQLEASVGSFASGGIAALRSLSVKVDKGSTSRKTRFNITTGTVYNAYEATQESNVRYAGPLSTMAADAGFDVLEWNGAPVAYDNEVLSGHWYMLNFENFGFRHSPSFMFGLSKIIESESQFSQSQKIATFGQFCTNAPRNLGVATGITA